MSLDAREPLARLAGERVLVTGAQGSIGHEIVRLLAQAGVEHQATDIDTLDVRDARGWQRALEHFPATVVLHLAGAKHAPEGETDPAGTVETNVTGTQNALTWADAYDARVVTASTCKACDPETVYGATKLIAERMTLNAGGSVARFYNVRESSGNVFEIWRGLPEDEPLPVAPCWRYFISLQDAAALTLWAAVLGPGRYSADPGPARCMPDVAAETHPDRARRAIPPRRGDRVREPLHAACESAWSPQPGLLRVSGWHDHVLADEPIAVAA